MIDFIRFYRLDRFKDNRITEKKYIFTLKKS